MLAQAAFELHQTANPIKRQMELPRFQRRQANQRPGNANTEKGI
jgi:hypothetical protein